MVVIVSFLEHIARIGCCLSGIENVTAEGAFSSSMNGFAIGSAIRYFGVTTAFRTIHSLSSFL